MNHSDLKAGESCHEYYDTERNHKPVTLCLLTYQHKIGIKYCCTKKTLKECEEARDNWIKRLEGVTK